MMWAWIWVRWWKEEEDWSKEKAWFSRDLVVFVRMGGRWWWLLLLLWLMLISGW